MVSSSSTTRHTHVLHSTDSMFVRTSPCAGLLSGCATFRTCVTYQQRAAEAIRAGHSPCKTASIFTLDCTIFHHSCVNKLAIEKMPTTTIQCKTVLTSKKSLNSCLTSANAIPHRPLAWASIAVLYDGALHNDVHTPPSIATPSSVRCCVLKRRTMPEPSGLISSLSQAFVHSNYHQFAECLE